VGLTYRFFYILEKNILQQISQTVAEVIFQFQNQNELAENLIMIQ